MVPILFAHAPPCISEQCSITILVHHRTFSGRSLKLKAIYDPSPAAAGAPAGRYSVAPDDTPTGGGSGGGALLGGEGAPGSGTGIPNATGGLHRS